MSTVISSLPYAVVHSGSYSLNTDLQSSGAGITINANDVTIDLMGYNLIGSGSGANNHGIYMSGDRFNVEVKNGTVRNFGGSGILSDGGEGKNHRIIEVRVIGNKKDGICLLSSNNHVRNCTIDNNGGTGLSTNNGGLIVNNLVYDNKGEGIHTGDRQGAVVIGNSVTGNLLGGIRLKYGGIAVSNQVVANGDTGIWAHECCVVTGNVVLRNTGHGIITEGGACTVCGNSSARNGGDGVYCEPGDTVSGNTIINNKHFGIQLAEHCLVDGNTIHGNNPNISSCSTCTLGLNHIQ
jgi:parallel beta-helix repeat protein